MRSKDGSAYGLLIIALIIVLTLGVYVPSITDVDYNVIGQQILAILGG